MSLTPRRSTRPRIPTSRIAIPVVVVAVVGGILLSRCASGTEPIKATRGKTPASSTPVAFALKVGGVHIQSTGPPAKLAPPVEKAVMVATRQYMHRAILAPLEQGQVDSSYTVIFDPGVKGPAATTDRAVLTDAVAGKATGPVAVTGTKVRIDALGDPTGAMALVATTFSLDVAAQTPLGHVTIRRITELTFANEFGRWLVTAYRIFVRRALGPSTTAATAHAGAAIVGGERT